MEKKGGSPGLLFFAPDILHMAKPNPITRAIIDSTVDRGIREVEEDPKRSIRKLTDMGRMFNRGPFLDEIYAMVQDLLRNDDSTYYTVIENLLRNTNRQNLKDFGINIGYNGFTIGRKTIQSLVGVKPFHIPWCISLRINPARHTSITVSEIESCVKQGRPLGIYCYVIRCEESIACLNKLLAMFRNNPDCSFFCLLPDQLLHPEHLKAIRSVTNTLFLFPADTPTVSKNIEAMRAQKSLYSVYIYYNDETAGEWMDGKHWAGLTGYCSSFILTVAADNCSAKTAARLGKYCRNMRTHPEYPFICFDFYSDLSMVDKIISARGQFFEMMENGDIHTVEGVLTDFRHTISLEQILSIALPLPAQDSAG